MGIRLLLNQTPETVQNLLALSSGDRPGEQSGSEREAHPEIELLGGKDFSGDGNAISVRLKSKVQLLKLSNEVCGVK